MVEMRASVSGLLEFEIRRISLSDEDRSGHKTAGGHCFCGHQTAGRHCLCGNHRRTFLVWTSYSTKALLVWKSQLRKNSRLTYRDIETVSHSS